MLEHNLNLIKNEIEKLKVADSVEIVPATKTVPAQIINQLSALGINAVGENRVQELLDKYDQVSGVNFQFIGALQSNKVGKIIDKVTLIHSLDRLSLAKEIDKKAQEKNIKVNVLIEVNIGREENKSGIFAEHLPEFIEITKSMKGLAVKGFMSVLPINASEELYEKMQRIYLNEKKNNPNITILSMGMSNDFKTALKYGANLIRPGRILFGERETNYFKNEKKS